LFVEDYLSRSVNSIFLLGAFAAHFLPYFFQGPRIFLYHYLPSLYFSILTLSHAMDTVFARVPSLFTKIILLSVVTTAAYFYYQLLPFVIGLPLSREGCEARSLLKTWEIDCKHLK
jgi:dolichyl-phosphate-mannose-protein mannosyltransferase